ncbi:MAG: AzlC family ABC transporter permease [Clostridia bacterium]|nr:AzlC family ABC transporter permease [Clostridia bacterium]
MKVSSAAKYTFKENKKEFLLGLKDGLPIGLGYFAVAFSLGVLAKEAGLSAFQGFLASILCSASAGEYVAFTLIGEGAAYLEVALATFVANARYMLMSCALSQKADPSMPFIHRPLSAMYITDELFGISIVRKSYFNPYYHYGGSLTAVPMWAVGTALGVVAGNILPVSVVSALSVALYGMFMAVFIPPAKKDKVIACLVVISFSLSFLAGWLPVISDIAEGTRTIILTVIIAGAAALLFPRKDDEEGTENG